MSGAIERGHAQLMNNYYRSSREVASGLPKNGAEKDQQIADAVRRAGGQAVRHYAVSSPPTQQGTEEYLG